MSTLRAWVLGHRIFRFWVFQVLVSFWFLGFLGLRFNGLRSGSPFLIESLWSFSLVSLGRGIFGSWVFGVVGFLSLRSLWIQVQWA